MPEHPCQRARSRACALLCSYRCAGEALQKWSVVSDLCLVVEERE